MLLFLLVLICILGEGFSLTENGWRDATLTFYGKMTKYLQEERIEKYGELLADDVVMIYPGIKVSGKDGLNKAEHNYGERKSVKRGYVAFVELLYTSQEVAVVRPGGYDDMRDGSHRLTKGLTLFVGGEGGLKAKLDIFNFN